MGKFLALLLVFSLTHLFAKLNIAVSIPPEAAFVKSIAADKAKIFVTVKPGDSPHTYEPKPSEMREIAKADIYFAIGVEFEKAWLPRFANQNKKMKIVDVSKGIKKYGNDPHIWTSPSNAEIIAENILSALLDRDPLNAEYYKKNYEDFIKSVESLKKRISKILKDMPKSRKFMVFHPSWGYFAKEFSLEQISVESEGKEPSPKELIKIMKKAEKEGIRVILVSPEFSDKSARIIASELGIKVVKISALSKDWSRNLLFLAKTIAGKN